MRQLQGATGPSVGSGRPVWQPPTGRSRRFDLARHGL